jgi:hypothetical protein
VAFHQESDGAIMDICLWSAGASFSSSFSSRNVLGLGALRSPLGKRGSRSALDARRDGSMVGRASRLTGRAS